MKKFPNDIYQKSDKNERYKKEKEFLRRQNSYYTKVHELPDEQLDLGLQILRLSNDDECQKW